MRRFECYVISIVLLMAILISGFAIWDQIFLYQTTTKELIKAMDANSKERETAMENQIKTGLDKTDKIVEQTKEINDHQTEILQDIQKLLKAHNAPLKRAAEASEEAAKAARASASASKKAVKEVQHKPLIERIFK